MAEESSDGRARYDSDHRWRRLVAYEKWMIRIWTAAFVFPPLAFIVSESAYEIALAALLIVGLPVFLVVFGTALQGMWHEWRGQLPAPNSWIDWNNSSWIAAWQEAWRRPRRRASADE